MPRPSPSRASEYRVTVFEAANEALKEVYVTWTSLPLFQVFADLSTQPPSVIAHWRPQEQRISFHSLEFNLTEESARDFIARHTAKPLPEGWKYILDR